MPKWSLDLQKYAEARKEQIDIIRKKYAFKLYSQIVQRTPVDTGRARGNWNISIGADDTSTNDKNIKPKYTNENDMPKPDGDEAIFISNHLPYIGVLEYGKYPDPPKKGSYDKKHKRWVIKSSGGFSKMAPRGMVGVTLAKTKDILAQAVSESKK